MERCQPIAWAPRGGSSAGQSSGLIIRQVVGSNPTRPTCLAAETRSTLIASGPAVTHGVTRAAVGSPRGAGARPGSEQAAGDDRSSAQRRAASARAMRARTRLPASGTPASRSSRRARRRAALGRGMRATRMLNQVDETAPPADQRDRQPAARPPLRAGDSRTRTTRATYLGYADKHIRPLIGHVQVGALDAERLRLLLRRAPPLPRPLRPKAVTSITERRSHTIATGAVGRTSAGRSARRRSDRSTSSSAER